MYDLIIVGGGPAGLTAGIYAMRARLETLLIEHAEPGGQMLLSPEVDNYPGIPSIGGSELAARIKEHAEGFGLSIQLDSIEQVRKEGDVFIVSGQEEYRARSVVVATGEVPRKLGAEGEAELSGRGVSYCATCDGFFFADKDVLVVGGGDSALSEALYLSGIARKVYIAHRRDEFRGNRLYQERVFSKPNIEVLWSTVVEKIVGKEVEGLMGEQIVSGVLLRNTLSSATSELSVDGVFMAVGNTPMTQMVECKKDEYGYIITDERMQTSVEGMFAAGDCRKKGLRQICTATSDGAVAASEAGEYLLRSSR
ncbi:MAG: thioredoxin-disulfide reductase [Methermicoccaceae archaeon]